jgi:hypothetical protein
MMKLILIGLLGFTLATTILESREITLENGKVLYIKSIDSSELTYIESTLGCSTKCASACLSFSTGSAAVQCTKHCGCDSLLVSENPKLKTLSMTADVTVEIYYPDGTSDTEIFIDSTNDDDYRVSVDYDDYSSGTTKNSSATAKINQESEYGYSSKEIVVGGDVYGSGQSVEVNVEATQGKKYVTASTGAGAENVNGTYVTYEYVEYEEGKVKSDGTNKVNNYEYVESTTSVETNGTETTTVTYTDGSVGGYGFNDTSVSYSESTTGTVYSEDEFNWWVNSQAVFGGSFGSIGLIGWIVLIGAVVVAALVAYKKIVENRKLTTADPVSSTVGYIRI